MKFFPALKIGLWNGWLFIASIAIVQIFNLFVLCSPQERTRLLDRNTFTKRQKILTIIGKCMVLIIQILAIFTPLPLGTPEFFIGLILYVIGVVGMLIATNNFNDTPENEQVTKGMYRYSRNPQEVSLTVAFIGLGFALGSGIFLILFIISRFFNHFQTLAQEEAWFWHMVTLIRII